MWRYLKIYKAFFKNSIIAEAQYRANFILLIIINIGWALVYIFLYVFIFNHIDQVGDWTYERSLILAATFLIAHSLSKFFFRKNLSNFARLVYYGNLDLILVKPLSSQFYTSLRQFYLRPFIRFVFAWAVLVVVLIQNNIQVTLWVFLSYLFLLLISTIITYSLWFMTCCSVFWIGNIENIYEFFHPILRATALPFDILPGILKEIFFFVIPLVFISTIPAKALLSFVSWSTVLYGIFIASLLLFLSHKLWNFALIRYSSASS